MKNLGRDRRGTFATIAAIIMPLLLLSVGVGVDYGLVLDAHQRMKAAADAAVLGAVSEAQEAYIKQEKVDLKALISTSASEFFKANLGETAFTQVTGITVTPNVNKNELSASLVYTASYKTNFMQMFGYKSITIANSARAVVNVRSYININFLIDVSASMGIGATDADIKTVANAVGCAFACHIGVARGSSPYDTARKAGAEMRIDTVRNAAISAVDLASVNSDYKSQVTFGIYKFSNELTTVMPASDARAGDFSYIKTAINSGIQLDIYNGGTNMENALASMEKLIPPSGTGLTPDNRIQYIIVLTDGVESGQAFIEKTRSWIKHPTTIINSPSQAYAGHEVNYALNSAACDKLKTNGVGVHFIYTEYLEPVYGGFGDHDKARFGFVTSKLFPIIPTRFATCAGSAANVIKASSPEEIKAEFSTLVKSLSAPLRLY